MNSFGCLTEEKKIPPRSSTASNSRWNCLLINHQVIVALPIDESLWYTSVKDISAATLSMNAFVFCFWTSATTSGVQHRPFWNLSAADPNSHSHHNPLWSAPGKNQTVSNPNITGLPEASFTITLVGFVRVHCCCAIYLCICVRFPLAGAPVFTVEYQFPTATRDSSCSCCDWISFVWSKLDNIWDGK